MSINGNLADTQAQIYIRTVGIELMEHWLCDYQGTLTRTRGWYKAK